MSDPIADMLTRIRNAQAVAKPDVKVPFSKIKYQIALIFKNAGFLGEVKRTGRGVRKVLELALKYNEDGHGRIAGLKRISRPGQRIYKTAGELSPVRGGFGLSVISTPEGLMSGETAKKKNLGGEVLAEIW